jgi:hypothetical protein
MESKKEQQRGYLSKGKYPAQPAHTGENKERTRVKPERKGTKIVNAKVGKHGVKTTRPYLTHNNGK